MYNPKLYADNFKQKKAGHNYVLENVFPKLNWSPNVKESIVDIGCGDGHVTVDILLPNLPQGTKVLGVDLSQTMIDYANEKYGRDNGNLTFKCVDLLNRKVVKQYENLFDKVFSFFCLHFVQNHKNVMNCIYEILKPGGTAIIVFPPKQTFNKAYREVAALPCWKKYMNGKENFKEPSEYIVDDPLSAFKTILTDSGFEILHCEMPHMKETYKSRQLVRNATAAIHPFLHQIPENLHDDFLDDHMKVLDRIAFLPEEGYIISYDLMIAYCMKPISL